MTRRRRIVGACDHCDAGRHDDCVGFTWEPAECACSAWWERVRNNPLTHPSTYAGALAIDALAAALWDSGALTGTYSPE